MRAALVLALAVALAERGVAGMPQAQSPPAQQTGAISGVVLDSVTNKPIAGAVVEISGTPTGPGGAPIAPGSQSFSSTTSAAGVVTVTEPPPQPFRPQRQLTDEQGRFVFVGLPGSMSYALTSGRIGYFDAAYGRRSMSGNLVTARRITLADGQWFRDARIEMVRPSAVSGRVLDESGDPVVGVAVRSYTEVYIGGARQTAAGPVALTDDRGVYRLGNLTPGRYLISVPSVQHAVPAATTAAEVAGMSPQAAAAQEPSRRDPSFPAGDYRTVVGATSPPMLPQAAGRPQIYATTFHPSARSVAEATAIQLQGGDDRTAVDVRLTPVPAFRISGTLEGPADAVSGMSLRLLLSGIETLGRGSESATALVGANGSFAFLNIPNGTYTILANRTITEYSYRPPGSTSAVIDSNAPGVRFTSMSTGAVQSGPQGTTLSRQTYEGNQRFQARQTVTVSGRDVADLVVPMQAGVTMRGELVFEGTRPAGMAQVVGGVRAEPANGDSSLGQPSFNGRLTPGAPSTEFVLEGLLPGAYLVRAAGTIKSIMWNGRDYVDTPFDTTTGKDFTGVVITVTDQTTTISGTIRDRAGQVATNTAAIVFPADRTRWMNFGIQPTRIRASAGSTGGAYTLRGLPAGDYLIVAVDDDLLDRWKDPAFLEAASKVATRLSIAWGETKSQELTVQEIR